MCGLVGYGVPTGLTESNLNFFENMLICDSVRGAHSTGVYFSENGCKHPLILKDVGNGGEFVGGGSLWDQYRSERDKMKHNKKPKINFIVGHNRWATAGAINARNAHPFQHGNITLVHNGTIDDVSLLPDNEKFVVDSENVCHSINKIGLEESIKKMDGAYTLIWHDKSDNTLHMLRNNSRPLYLMETTAGAWLWGSEEDMMKWLTSRGKWPMHFKQQFELKVGEEIIFDVNGTFKLKERKQHTLPTFPKYYPSTYRGNDYRNSTYNNTGNVIGDVTNRLLEQNGIHFKRGDRIEFESYNFKPHSNNSLLGNMEGYHFDGCYFEVMAYNVRNELYREGDTMTGEIVSARLDKDQNYVIVVVSKVDNPKAPLIAGILPPPDKEEKVPVISDYFPEEFDDDIPFDEAAQQETVELDNRQIVTRAQWNAANHSCDYCTDLIPFEDAADAIHLGGCDGLICPHCWDEFSSENS